MPNAIPRPRARAWMNATCAVLTKMTRRAPRHDLLGGAAKTSETTLITRTILARSWDIADREKLRSTLAWLRDEGNRAERDLNADDGLGPAGLLAWDYVRLVAVAGWGYVADYITEEEAWSFIAPAATTLQQTYGSWRELGQAYVRGTFLWEEQAGPGAQYNYAALMREHEGPWRTIPWRLDLNRSVSLVAITGTRTSLTVYAVASAVMMVLVSGLWFSVGRGVFHGAKSGTAPQVISGGR